MTEPRRAVLLDAVGTLIEASPGVYEVYRQAAIDECQVELPVEVIRQRLGEAMRSLLAAEQTTSEQGEREFWRSVVRATFPEAESTGGTEGECRGQARGGANRVFDRLFDRLWDHFARAGNWRVYSDVAEAWDRLEQSGLVVGIASNFDQRLVTIGGELPPLDRAAHIFTSARLGYRKPHEGFFRRIEAELGLPPQACLLIGDQLDTDVLGAVRAGWRAIWIDRSPPTGVSSVPPVLPPALPPALTAQVVRVGSLTEAAGLVSES